MNISALKINGQFPTNFLPLDMANCQSFDDYCEIGSMIQTTVLNHQWWVGDWLIFGEDHFPDIYTQAIELTGNSLQNLMNYRRVAGAFPPERRVPELSFSAHRELAPLSEEEQDAIIGLALKYQITDSRGVSKLKKEMKSQVKIAVEEKEENGFTTGDVVVGGEEEVFVVKDEDMCDWDAEGFQLEEEEEEAEASSVDKNKLLSKPEQMWIDRLFKDGQGTLEKARVGVGYLKNHINPTDLAAFDRVISQLREVRAWYMS